MQHKSCLLPHWSNCFDEPSWEAELSRLVLLRPIPLISDVVFSWGEALSKSLQTSSSVNEVDSESRAPRDETLARSEFWSWDKKANSTEKRKTKIFLKIRGNFLCVTKFKAWIYLLGKSLSSDLYSEPTRNKVSFTHLNSYMKILSVKT